jgi:CRP-like cAMP-binding protein
MAALMEKQQLRSNDFVTLLTHSGAIAKFQKIRRNEILFSQGSRAETVFYIHEGIVALNYVSRQGKEAIVAILTPGSFVGERCLTGCPVRIETATALCDGTVASFGRKMMLTTLSRNPDLAEKFIGYLIRRNARLECDLIDKLINSSEKRLARLLLLLVPAGEDLRTQEAVTNVNQDMLAHMIGMTRTRVSFFMNKFRRLGFIDYDKAGLRVYPSLLATVLRR